ncbi:hypothetical protein Nepgr_014509 [Nepenthes gracilis]|uniref:Uncharacterized protein n=1 Tax=Nepenthes gracilis TaxID=150966 RepID=A0AAD3SK56_NEPGR|nr:hypothetical protein Nepgr_014509 [Nepenthes gracilis]
MTPVRLSHGPLRSPRGLTEILDGGIDGVIHRAVVIGSGFLGKEKQCTRFIPALEIPDKPSHHLAVRPRGGIIKGLHLLLVSLFKKLAYIMRQIRDYSRILFTFGGKRSAIDNSIGLHQKDDPLLEVAGGRGISSASDYGFAAQVRGYAALHQIDSAALTSAAGSRHDEFAHLPKPLIVVNIGAPSRHCRYGAELAKQLAAYLRIVLPRCGTVRISFSEKTPKKIALSPALCAFSFRHCNHTSVAFARELSNMANNVADSMRPVRLSHGPLRSPRGLTEILDGGIDGVIHRAVVIGSGFLGKEKQCTRFVPALEIPNKPSHHLAARPRGGIIKGLHLLLVSLFKKLAYIMRQIRDYSRILFTFGGKRSAIDNSMGLHQKDDPLLEVAGGRGIASASDYGFAGQVRGYAALHQIDSAALTSAAGSRHDEFAHLPKPLIVVNIGAPSRHCRYGAELAKQLAAYLRIVLPRCGTVSKVIVKELRDDPKVHISDGKEPNPRTGHLACADAFIVTADSISALSEACSTGYFLASFIFGNRVYVAGDEFCTGKLSEFHKKMKERGFARPLMASVDVDGLVRLMEGEQTGPINIGKPGDRGLANASRKGTPSGTDQDQILSLSLIINN